MLVSVKWFGAWGFGRKYFEANRVWVVRDGTGVKLDRSNQTDFIQYLDRAERVFEVDGLVVRQSFFVPDQVRAFVMTLESDSPSNFEVEPQFDMRYYQSINQDLRGYMVRTDEGLLRVSNHVHLASDTVDELDFFATVGPVEGQVRIRLLPESEWFRHKTYLWDEHRLKAIHRAYTDIHEMTPDHAPIWDVFHTTAFAPARLTGAGPLTLTYSFGDTPDTADACFADVRTHLPRYRREKDEDVRIRLEDGNITTGRPDVDLAYRQIMTHFNQALVARGIEIHGAGGKTETLDAIFAGNKYFLDPWKRDENISLAGLLRTGDFKTTRDILEDTWSFQDPRTGRLPQIIRLGEPVVYFSSDGTLWALQRLHEYTRASGDVTLLDQKYDMVERFFTASLDFVQRGLLPSGGIVDRSYLWETWEDTPYTPRDGYPVEIELLWLTQLVNFLPTIGERSPALADRLEATLNEGRDTFRLFELDGYLADSLAYNWEPRSLLTPNGYVTFALNYPLSDDLQRGMVLVARDQLAGRCGIRSLAPRDWPKVLSADLLLDPRCVRGKEMAGIGLYNYHRGIEWLWPAQFMVQGELHSGSSDLAYSAYLAGQVHCTLAQGGVGGLPELYDMHGPLGADFQAWSMAGFIEGLFDFAGITVDAGARRIEVRPSIPHLWPYITCRSRIAETYFDVHHRKDGQTQTIEVQTAAPAPRGYTLRLGVRWPAGKTPREIILNDRSIPSAQWTTVAGYAPDVDGEVWIESQLMDVVTAVFR